MGGDVIHIKFASADGGRTQAQHQHVHVLGVVERVTHDAIQARIRLPRTRDEPGFQRFTDMFRVMERSTTTITSQRGRQTAAT